jgi:O-antigen ligase
LKTRLAPSFAGLSLTCAWAARGSVGLLALAATLPFLLPARSHVLPSFYGEWIALALGLGAATLLVHPQVRDRLQIPVIGIVPLGLCAVFLLQWALGRITYPELALIAALYLLWAFALVLVGAALRREIGLAGIAPALAWAILCGGFLGALWALLTHYQISLTLGSIFVNFRSPTAMVRGYVGQSNHFADYLALALASGAYLVARRKLYAPLAVGLGGVLLLTMALTGARSAWVYCAALLIFAFWFYRRQPGADARRLLVCAASIMAGFALMQGLATLSFMSPERAAVSGQRLLDLATTTSVRSQFWGEAWHAFLAAPLLGVGWGQFAWHHFDSALNAGTQPFVLTQNAHNLMLHLLAETGLCGAMIAAGGIGAWLIGLKRMTLDLHAWWLLAVLGVIALHSQIEFPLWYAHFLGIGAVLLGAGATQFFGARTYTLRASSIVLALGVGWFVAITTFDSYRELDRLLFAPGADASSTLQQREFAEKLTEVQSESLLTPYAELAIAFAIAPDKALVRAQLELNTRVLHFLPVPDVAYKQAMLLMLSGDSAGALDQLRHAAAAYPDELATFNDALAAAARETPGAYALLLEFTSSQLRDRAR